MSQAPGGDATATTAASPARPEPVLHVQLLGGLALRHGSVSLPPIESARAESLLAYLLLHRAAPQPRQHLAFLLWPDSTEAQARTNLRHVLHTLRRCLPDPDRVLDVQPRFLQWRPDAPFTLDVDAFETGLDRAERMAAHRRTAQLRAVVRRYTGELLPGHSHEWVLDERERLRRRYVAALWDLTHELEAAARPGEGVAYAEQLVRQEPLQEEAHRLLIRLHHACGNRARALRAYHACVATLDRELGVEPDAATRALHDTLLATEPAQPSSRPTPLERAPLVGRTAELERVAGLWPGVARGQPHLVLLSGEPGIGKSRLADELRRQAAGRGARTATSHCYRTEGNVAYGPVVAWLRSEALRPVLGRLHPARLTELARLLPDLLAAFDGLDRPEPLPEQEQRQRLLDALAAALRAAGGPLALVVDDLQWCDPETLQVLHFLLRADTRMPLLVVATARREDVGDADLLDPLLLGLERLGRWTELPLARLSRDETLALAAGVTGTAPARPDALFSETEGNPLFVIEALRAGWDGRAGRPWVTARLRAAIAARLADLSAPALRLSGVAATIGRAFSADVLAAASDLDPGALVDALDELWRRRIVREQGRDAYDFSHDKIREVAYGQLGPATRRRNHLRVAEALQRHAAAGRGHAAVVAGHYEAGGAPDEAVTWYQRATVAAQHLHANTEAVRLLERAIALLGTLPDTAERRGRELELVTALPAVLVPVEGYLSPRVGQAQARALELARRLGAEPAAPLVRSLAITALGRDDFDAARAHASELRARGARTGDDVLVVEAEYVLGATAFWDARFRAARAHFAAAAERFRPEQRRAHLLRYGQDARALALTRLGHTLWFLGYPRSAAEACDAAAAAADEADHPYTHSAVQVFSAMVALELGDEAELRACAARLAGTRHRHARHNRIIVEVLRGYVDILDGQRDAVGRIRRAIVEPPAEAAAAPGASALALRLLLAACVAAGDRQHGLVTAERLLEARGGAGVWRAEAHRTRARWWAEAGAAPEEVDAELERAVEVARGQAAAGLELRAVSDLLRHRRDHRVAGGLAAHGLLEDVIGRLPERVPTPDLDRALALLGA